jgi:hypothetical protein
VKYAANVLIDESLARGINVQDPSFASTFGNERLLPLFDITKKSMECLITEVALTRNHAARNSSSTAILKLNGMITDVTSTVSCDNLQAENNVFVPVNRIIDLLLMVPYGCSCKEFMLWEECFSPLQSTLVEFIIQNEANIQQKQSIPFVYLAVKSSPSSTFDDCIVFPTTLPTDDDISCKIQNEEWAHVASWCLSAYRLYLFESNTARTREDTQIIFFNRLKSCVAGIFEKCGENALEALIVIAFHVSFSLPYSVGRDEILKLWFEQIAFVGKVTFQSVEKNALAIAKTLKSSNDSMKRNFYRHLIAIGMRNHKASETSITVPFQHLAQLAKGLVFEESGLNLMRAFTIENSLNDDNQQKSFSSNENFDSQKYIVEKTVVDIMERSNPDIHQFNESTVSNIEDRPIMDKQAEVLTLLQRDFHYDAFGMSFHLTKFNI